MTQTSSDERHEALLAALHDGVLFVDAAGTVTGCNDRAARLLGVRRDDLVGSAAAAVGAIGADGPIDPAATPWAATRRTGRPLYGVELGLDGPTGPVWVSVNTHPVGAPAAAPYPVVVTLSDLTESRRMADELRRTDAQLRLLADTATDLVSRHDLDGMWLFASDAARALLGMEPAQLLGVGLYELIHPDDVEPVTLAHAGWLEQPTDFTITYRLRRADGEYLWVETIGRSVADPHTGEMLELHATTRDITDRKQVEQQLAELALSDPLTGLANRAALLERLRAALDRSERLTTTVALLFLDLNRFKQVNDELGHAAGDELLVGVAERLRQAIRGADMVARLGGDEFVVVCQDVRDADEALTVARRVVERVQVPMALAGRGVTPTTSIGVALARSHLEQVEALLARADRAMYHAKRKPGEVRVHLAS